MQSINSIHSLIQSLSKTEKRYFRLISDLQKGEKNYLKLFNVLEKNQSVTPELICELEEAFPGNSIEPARKHLYQVIMRSLRQFEAERDEESKLFNLLQESRILNRKGLYKLSLETLKKVKLESKGSEKNLFYVLAARNELEFLSEKLFIGVDEIELVGLQEEITKLLEKEVQVNKHYTLYEILLFRYLKHGLVRSQQQVTQLNDLLLEEYNLLNQSGKESFASHRLHLLFQSVYFQMTGNVEGSMEGYYELDNLFQENPSIWKNSPEIYIKILVGIISGLLRSKKEDQISFFLERLKEIRNSTSLVNHSVSFILMDFELRSFISQGRAEDALAHWKANSTMIESELIKVPPQVNAQLMFTLCRVYFLNSEYHQAVKLINDELNKPASHMNQYIRTNFLLFNLQVNSLLDKKDYLHYALRSIERKLKSNRKLFNSEQFIISILKKWLNYRPINKFKKKLKKLDQNPIDRQILEDLNIHHWLEVLVKI